MAMFYSFLVIRSWRYNIIILYGHAILQNWIMISLTVEHTTNVQYVIHAWFITLTRELPLVYRRYLWEANNPWVNYDLTHLYIYIIYWYMYRSREGGCLVPDSACTLCFMLWQVNDSTHLTLCWTSLSSLNRISAELSWSEWKLVKDWAIECIEQMLKGERLLNVTIYVVSFRDVLWVLIQ